MITTQDPTARRNNARMIGAVIFALLFPTLITYVYFVWLAQRAPSIAQIAYGVGKTVQFGFPLVCVLFLLREKLTLTAPSTRGLGFGLLFGVAVGASMAALYFLWMEPAGYFETVREVAKQKLQSLGFDSLPKYIALGVFYSLAHSFLEEYYWRWFVFGQMRKLLPFGGAVAISSLGFMAHHVVVLAQYFGWDSIVTYLFSLAVAIGGAVWAWLYEHSRSLYGPWLSHLVADAAIFVIGYHVVWAG